MTYNCSALVHRLGLSWRHIITADAVCVFLRCCPVESQDLSICGGRLRCSVTHPALLLLAVSGFGVLYARRRERRCRPLRLTILLPVRDEDVTWAWRLAAVTLTAAAAATGSVTLTAAATGAVAGTSCSRTTVAAGTGGIACTAAGSIAGATSGTVAAAAAAAAAAEAAVLGRLLTEESGVPDVYQIHVTEGGETRIIPGLSREYTETQERLEIRV